MMRMVVLDMETEELKAWRRPCRATGIGGCRGGRSARIGVHVGLSA